MGIKVTLTEEQMDEFLDSPELMTVFNLLFDDVYESMQGLGTKLFKDIENKTVVKNNNQNYLKNFNSYVASPIISFDEFVIQEDVEIQIGSAA